MRNIVFACALLSIGLPLYLSAAKCKSDVTSKTFFTTRTPFLVSSPEILSSWRGQQCLFEDECNRTAIQAIALGGKSTHPNKLARYFMPFGAPSVPTTSLNADTDNHLFVQNFNIPNVGFTPVIDKLFPLDETVEPYSSVISMRPEQSLAAIGLSFQYNFRLSSRQHWLRINAPLMHVQSSMNLCEQVMSDGIYTVTPILSDNLNTVQSSMKSALSQPQWLYGKIDDKVHSKTEVAFVQIQLGEIMLDSDCYYFSPFIGATVPTGNTPRSTYVFEPVVGNGNHAGVFWGFTSEMLLGQSSGSSIEVGGAVDVIMEYLFKKKQRRSVDLKNRAWSRYSELYENAEQAALVGESFLAGKISQAQAIFINSPGINLLTPQVIVRPGFNFTANFAITLLQNCCNGFESEFGYNFYAKQAECVTLKYKNFNPEQAALKDQVGTGFTNQVRTITENTLLNQATIANLIINDGINQEGAVTSYQRSIIQPTDLDLTSAAHPTTLSNIVYGTLGYHWGECAPMFIGLGASYEFSLTTNTTMNRWLAWGRLEVSF